MRRQYAAPAAEVFRREREAREADEQKWQTIYAALREFNRQEKPQ